MKKIDDRIYKAKDGCFIVRKIDNFIMGEEIDLGSSDSIKNYKDVKYTEESYREFYKSIGIEFRLENEINTFENIIEDTTQNR